MRRSGRARERGASLVEFALVVPLLTLFLFGIVQFGIAYDRQQSINSAAREGARLGALPETSLEQIGDRSVEAAGMTAVSGEPKVVVYAAASSTASGVRCPGDTYSSSDSCTSPTEIDETDAELMPCSESVSAPYVRVVVSTPYDITIPFFGVQTVDIDSEAEFRCE